MVCDNELLYAFGTKKDNDNIQGFLYVYDIKLKLQNKIDITQYGGTHYKAVLREGYLYFSNSVDSNDKAEDTVTV